MYKVKWTTYVLLAVICLSYCRADDLASRAKRAVASRQADAVAIASEISQSPGYSSRSFAGIQAFLSSSPAARSVSLPAMEHLEALRLHSIENDLDKVAMEEMMLVGATPNVLRDSSGRVKRDADPCPYVEVECDKKAPYRAIDGTCNNLKNSLWGSALTPFVRFLEPDYGNGFNSPRLDKNDDPLPSARDVSRSIYEDVSHPSHVHTLMHMTFGQFLDHDIDRTAISKLADVTGNLVDITCGMDGCQTAGAENEECFPIVTDMSDPTFFDVDCLQFVRSAPVVNTDCTGPRQQLNQITSPIDGSQVYGSDATLANDLRIIATGHLRGSTHPTMPGGKELLPLHDEAMCRDVDNIIRCFLAGDARVNEHVGLSALHTVFFRMHNALVDDLAALNPHWDGERLYQEARRIVGATLQVITYREYLPVVLGPDLMHSFGLNLLTNDYFKVYDKDLMPDASNVFATAAFRFGHSQIGNLIRFTSQDYEDTLDTEFSNVFFRPAMNFDTNLPGGKGIDSVMLGMISQPAEISDRFFPKQVTDHMFTDTPPFGPGTDLPALNTQRGRDHGLPGYNEWRDLCGLPKAATFDDLADTISSQTARNKLEALYDHVDDIDLFAAAMSEDHVPGGMVGPTFGCIIARQFRNLKFGDRFWHERKNKHTGFSQDQLAEIRKMSLARVMCDNLDNVEDVQKSVMLQPLLVALENAGVPDLWDVIELYTGDTNDRKPCSDINGLDLVPWIETP